MRRVYVRSDLAVIAWRGRNHTRIDREKRGLEEAIAARDEAVEAATKDRAHYQADLEAVAVKEMAHMEVAEELARVAADEELARLAAHEAMTLVQRVHWDSSLAKATEHHRREESLQREPPPMVPRKGY
jgi:hypothetical protein